MSEAVNGIDGKPMKVVREYGYLYFIGKDGAVMKAKLKNSKPKQE